MSKIIGEIRDDIGRMRRRIGMDFLSFRKFYFPHCHSTPDGDFQNGISELLFNLKTERGARLAIAAPRGFAKSTIVDLEYVIYCICYKLENFIIIISSTSGQAKGFLDPIRVEFETNERLKKDFPEVCEVGRRLGPPRWTREEIVTSNGVKVIVLGSGQEIRGRRHGVHRPSLIILDDIESDENAQNAESYYKLDTWLSKSVLKAGDPRTNVIYIGTIHHVGSLLAKYTDPQQAPGWTARIYKAIIKFAERVELWECWKVIYFNLESYGGELGPAAARRFYQANKEEMLKGAKLLWPEYMDYYGLMVMREEGQASFDCEMQNDPINPRDCAFNMKEVHYWEDNVDSEKHLLSSMQDEILIYGSCDPSLGKEGGQGDYSAIMVVAWNSEKGTVYVLEADLAKRDPDKTIEDIMAHHINKEIVGFGFETNQFQEVMAKDLLKRARTLNIAVRLKEIRNTVDKKARIQSLQALIKSGAIQFSRKHSLLLEELKYFPKGHHDDGLDALEMVVRLCYKPSSAWNRFYDDLDD